jgi:hypothetical protein
MAMQASMVSALIMVAWPVHPPLTLLRLIPLLCLTLMMMEKRVANKMKMMSEAFQRPPQLFLVLSDNGGERRLKLQGSSFSLSSAVLFGKTKLFGFANRSIQFGLDITLYVLSFSLSNGLEDKL